MSSSSVNQNEQNSGPAWPAYVIPPFAAALAFMPSFPDMAAKSALQRGQAVKSLGVMECVKGGAKIAPTVGGLVAFQMLLQKKVEKMWPGESGLFSVAATSTAVGFVSSPILAAYNGKTMGWSFSETLRRFTPSQALTITLQESFFVMGIVAGEWFVAKQKQSSKIGKPTEYAITFAASALGGVLSHPANTVLTRLQDNLTIDSRRQLLWGMARRVRGVGVFSMGYKFCKENVGAAFEQK